MEIEQIEQQYYEKKKAKQLQNKIKQSKKLDLLVDEINQNSKYLVVGRFRGTDFENQIINGYGLERLILAPKNNLDEIILTKFQYNNLFKKLDCGGWVIFNPVTDFTLTRN